VKFNSRALVYAGVALAVIVAINFAMVGRPGLAEPAPAPTTQASSIVAGPGRVEPASEEVRVSAQIGGTLKRVTVEEGDRVLAGQVLAVLENDDYRARVASAEAELRLKDAEGRRVANGARDEERREAAAALREAEAVLRNARADQERRRVLFAQHVISGEEMDHADDAVKIAEARAEALRQRHELVDAAAREEDASRAAADLALARAHLDEMRAVYEKTFVRAPISGLVLRKHRKAGESVSTQFDSPIVTLGDQSALRVRVDVDEADVGSVEAGQAAYVTADAFGARRFPGRVIRVGRVLGKKNVRTDEPIERVDQKILETLVELDGGQELPVGLRVQAFIVKK
jgi:ABC exporter DevB family membrane fusion protein